MSKLTVTVILITTVCAIIHTIAYISVSNTPMAAEALEKVCEAIYKNKDTYIFIWASGRGRMSES